MNKEEEQQVQVDADSPAQLEKEVNTLPTKHETHVDVNKGFNAINLFDPKQLAAAENFLTKVMRSDKGGIKSVNDGLAILMRAKDLQIPFSTSLEHIHVINGKTGIDIHIIKALLLKAGTITWKCTKNNVSLYEYVDNSSNAYVENKLPETAIKCASRKEADAEKEKDAENEHVYVYPVKYYQDFNGNIYKDYMLNTKQFAIVANKIQAQEVIKSQKIPVFRIPAQPVDYITEYEFTRYHKIFDKVIETKSVSSFTYSEAVTAGFMEKENYKKYLKTMIAHRAFTLGARDIGSDILMGCMETTELKQINNIDIVDADVTEVL